MKNIFLIVFILFSIFSTGIAKSEGLVRDSDNGRGGTWGECIPFDHFGVSGVKLSMVEGEITKAIGKPKNTSQGVGEDDGGDYTETTYNYDGFNVYAVRGDVDRIVVSGDSLVLESGIKIGMTVEGVFKIFGRTPKYWNENLKKGRSEISFFPCETPADIYAIFKFKKNKLNEIEFVVDRP